MFKERGTSAVQCNFCPVGTYRHLQHGVTLFQQMMSEDGSALIAAICAAVVRSHASSQGYASSPLINSNVSRNSASDIFDTDAPRFGEISSNPSAANTLNASRKGVRELPSVSHSSSSFSFLPG